MTAKRNGLVSNQKLVLIKDELSGLHNVGTTNPSNSRAMGLCVVGASSYIRDHTSPEILSRYDIQWVLSVSYGHIIKMCVIAIDKGDEHKYITLTGEGPNTPLVIKSLLEALSFNPAVRIMRSNKLTAWLRRDIMLLNKISCRDVLHEVNHE